MQVKTFYDQSTGTFTHIVIDDVSKKCAVIDSVLNYDPSAARFSTYSADQVVQFIKQNKLTNEWILETHIHADHITAAFYLSQHIGGKTAIGSRIKEVLAHWVPLFDLAENTPITGEQFDHLFEDGETFTIGNLNASVIHTPGHTPACSTYHIANSIFVGDTLFAPRMGTARADFPGGSPVDLYQSIQKLYQLPDDTQIYLCHDYPSQEEEPISKSSVGEQKTSNKMLRKETAQEEFISLRNARDKNLPVPKLILPSLQTNMRLGSFGPKRANDIQYLNIPVNIV